MPNNPVDLSYHPGVQGLSYVHSIEYEQLPFAVCAVCYAPTKHTTILISAHTSCLVPLAGQCSVIATLSQNAFVQVLSHRTQTEQQARRSKPHIKQYTNQLSLLTLTCTLP